MAWFFRQLTKQSYKNGCCGFTASYNGEDAVTSEPWETLGIISRVLEEVMGNIGNAGGVFR